VLKHILPILNLAKVPTRDVRLPKPLRTDSLLFRLDTGLDDGGKHLGNALEPGLFPSSTWNVYPVAVVY
jgi:hypothetical protein